MTGRGGYREDLRSRPRVVTALVDGRRTGRPVTDTWTFAPVPGVLHTPTDPPSSFRGTWVSRRVRDGPGSHGSRWTL